MIHGCNVCMYVYVTGLFARSPSSLIRASMGQTVLYVGFSWGMFLKTKEYFKAEMFFYAANPPYGMLWSVFNVTTSRGKILRRVSILWQLAQRPEGGDVRKLLHGIKDTMFVPRL